MAPTTRMGRVTAAACIAVMGAAGLSACTASGATDGGRTGEEEATALPPGVLPPNDPPQPGDARLGPDGHYDYSAPDFELKNPCDTGTYQVALNQGWKPPSIGQQFKDQGNIQYCGITKGSTGIAIYTLGLGHIEVAKLASELDYHSVDERSWYTAVIPGQFGDSCLAGAFGPDGGHGIFVGIGGFSNYSTKQEACMYAEEQFETLFGENNAV